MVERKQTAIAKPYSIIEKAQVTILDYEKKSQLTLPEDYALDNALKSAYLILGETLDKNKQPVLKTCTEASICNALLDMAVQGLNPGKKQCYFIAYGTKLLCQRSYFGTMAVAKQVAGVSEIWAEVVYKGDILEYEITSGRKSIKSHTQKLGDVNGENIEAAYCVLTFENGKASYTEIMTIDQIHKSWLKSRADLGSPAAVHSMFPEEMCKRTVISRACKKYINSSTDNNLFLEHFHRSSEEQTEEEVAEEITENANQKILEIESKTGGEPDNATPEATAESTTNAEVTEEPEPKRDPNTIKTLDQFFKACKEDWGLDEKQVCKELGVSSRQDITIKPSECYFQVAAVWNPGPEQVEEGPGF